MGERKSILIVEDDSIQAMDLADALESAGASVIGPVATVAEALALLDGQPITGAILDANLLDRDVTPVALRLIDLDVPFLIHTGIGLPDDLAAAFPYVSVIMKPAPAAAVVRQLLDQLDDLHGQSVDPLGIVAADGADRLDRIASALHGQFGEKAMLIARRQMVGAQGQVRRSWQAILDRLAGLDAG